MSEPKVYTLRQDKPAALVPSGKAPARGADAVFVTDIPEPELIVFPAEGAPTTEAAVIICPGGGYSGVALTIEGYECAQWLAGQGVTGMVLKYRQPGGVNGIPLEDIQTAIRTVRGSAGSFGICPDRIGVCGFSSGGHLAATASTLFTKDTRPDFAMLYYPVIILDEALGGPSRDNLLGPAPTLAAVERYSCHLQVRPDTPPTLIMLSDNDNWVSTVHSTSYYDALKKQGIPASLHIFPQGDHGWGFRGSNEYIPAAPFDSMDEMKSLTKKWLKYTLNLTR